MFDDSRGGVLLAIANGAIAEVEPRPCEWQEPWLREHAATFVTLRIGEGLRGCIGTIDPHRALGDDVAHNAHAAAYRDSRFPPLESAERPQVRVEVSLLSPREVLPVANEGEALAAVRPGIDGLYLEYRHFRGTFLPQVWESIPDPLDFLGELKRKAGLPRRFWHADLKLSRYTVEKFR